MTVWQAIFWVSAAVLIYTHVVYPAGMMLVWIGRRRPECATASPQERCPRVTLVIPVHNEEQVLARKLHNTAELDYPRNRLEVLVANDGSGDRTAEIARSYSARGIRLLDFPQRRGKASVMNDAVAAARGELICFSDANVDLRPDALSRLVARLAEPSVGAVSGDVQLQSHQTSFGQGERAYYRIERAMQAGESLCGSMIGVDGGLYVVRRQLCQPLPPDTILDDFVVSLNVIAQGFRVVYVPEAIATEDATLLASDEFHRRVRVQAGAIQTLKRAQWPPLWRPVELWQYVSHKLLRWLGPVWLVGLLWGNVCLQDAGWGYPLFLVGQVGLWLLAAVATCWPGFRQTWLGGVLFYFALSHLAMSVGALKGLVNAQRVTWRRAARQVPALSELTSCKACGGGGPT
ncbi:MAG: glycosyltransferase family 2 protein [Pirellulaceae bacterium]|nr:glycosyltransferase family 2 protein [Pirellulaceae bacterium]